MSQIYDTNTHIRPPKVEQNLQNRAHKLRLAKIVDQAISQLDGLSVTQKSEFIWCTKYYDQEIQILIENAFIEECALIRFYFPVIQLPDENQGECIRGLMNAHYHTCVKYAIFDNCIVQLVELQPNEEWDAVDVIKFIIRFGSMAVLLRNELYSKFFNLNAG